MNHPNPRYLCEQCAGVRLPDDGTSFHGVCDSCFGVRFVNSWDILGKPRITLSKLAVERLNDLVC